MEKKFKSIVAASFISLSTAACTTNMYAGDPRPDSELATIRSISTAVMKVDDKKTPFFGGGNYAEFKVLPGRHKLHIYLNAGYVSTADDGTPVYFEAEAGETYITKPVMNHTNRTWYPTIVRESDGKEVVLQRAW